MVAWIVIWVLVGLLVFHEVRSLSTLSDTVSRAGRAVETSGRALATGSPRCGASAARWRSRTRSAVRRSRERSTTALTYLFFGADTGTGTRNRLAERLVARQLPHPEGFVGLTGVVPARGPRSRRSPTRCPGSSSRPCSWWRWGSPSGRARSSPDWLL